MPVSPDTAARPCCLIAEDQTLIGMSLEAYLEEMGFDIAGPFAREKEALAWLETNAPHLAILDYKLGEGTCTNLARELNGRDVPVIVYSGIKRGRDLPPELQAACWLEKPAPRSALLKVVTELLPSRREEIEQPL